MAFDSSNIDDFSSNNFNDEDPAAEFLQREKQELDDIIDNDNHGNSFSNGMKTVFLLNSLA